MSAGRGRRTGLILIVLILIILVIGVGAIFLLQNVLGGITGGGQQPQAQVDLPPTPTTVPVVNIIVAARDIPRGARLTAQDVTIMRWPELAEAPRPIDALVVAEGDPTGLEQVNGRIARVDIITGQPVLNFMLTPGEDPSGLGQEGSDTALLIPSGLVMITMPIDRLSAVGFSLREGDHVDVLMSFSFIPVDEEFQSPLPNQQLILTDDTALAALGLQNLQLAAGREDTGPFGTSLIITPNEAGPIAQPVTQLVVDNAIVMRLGDYPITDLNQPIVITPAPPATPDPNAPEGEAVEPTPVPIIFDPEIVSLAMSRQDALVLKYALEQGAAITLALRSALDNDITDVATDPVTLEYIIQIYDVAIPTSLTVALDTSASEILDAVFTEQPAQAP